MVACWRPKRKGDPQVKKPGSDYSAIDTAVDGVQVCEHLSRLARQMKQVTAVRTVHHDVIDEHAAATNRMHTGRDISGRGISGRGISGTLTYPSIGYPNVTRGRGSLGASSGYLYLTDTSRGPAELSRPDSITPVRQAQRESFLATLRELANRDGRSFGKDAEHIA